VASSYGADTYLASDILPEEGDKRGKGENLWKAIHQLKGDIICYVDADISNIHPRFVYGLVAPLIQRAEVQYVKAFYDRPLNYSSGLRSSGGGRVTEILIRPLFSLFYPELTNIIQPLSGEYAARREVLEIIPFPIGYGVETSHLLDLYLKFGLDAFAQTDLDRRVHRNQTTNALGKMSFGILQTFINRLHSQGKIDRIPDMETFYRRFQVEDGSYNQLTQEVVEEERPAMIEVTGYQNRELCS
jgi:glucosyl-3-phosphoglycerate synthase